MDFFEILHDETDQEVHQNYINGFRHKNQFVQKGHFGPKNGATS